VGSERTVTITTDTDVVTARTVGRELAAHIGFSRGDQTVIAAAISEIARNILTYARTGEVRIRTESDGESSAVVIVARDQGPGIADIEKAMQDGWTTSGGLGLGLSGSKRLMDEFDIVSGPGRGTIITMKKWRRRG
jgi:serine/threonine-protein kinase RsbT